MLSVRQGKIPRRFTFGDISGSGNNDVSTSGDYGMEPTLLSLGTETQGWGRLS